MNAKDLVAVQELINAATAPLIAELAEFKSNAPKATAWRVAAKARIKFLEKQVDTLIDQVAALTPAPKPKFVSAPTNRIPRKEWDAAHAVMCLQHPGQKMFNPDDVRALAERLKLAPPVIEQAAPMECVEEEDVAL